MQRPRQPAGAAPARAPGAPLPKKARKPYVITKNRENWTPEEHQQFLDALRAHGRNWKRIEQAVRTKNVIQIRSHAQKYFLKVQKNNTGEQIPPPRPKRKSAASVAAAAARAASAARAAAAPPAPRGRRATRPAASAAAAAAFAPALARAQAADPALFAAQRRRGAASTHTAPNFAKIYAVFACMFDPHVDFDAVTSLRDPSLTPLDKEIIKLLISNLELNIADAAMRQQLIATYRRHLDPVT